MISTANSDKEIFLHVGTGKTGTTFMQYRVFPFLQGIRYIQRTQYKHAVKLILNGQESKFLISREFDQQLEVEVKKFAKHFPNTTPIIVFRRHDSYIASQYRRFVKNGFAGSFRDFFDIENNRGRFKIKDLSYFDQVKLLNSVFAEKPVVLLYSELKDEPKSFVQKFAKVLSVSIDIEKIDWKKKHRSYSTKQLKAIQYVGKFINLRKRRIFNNAFGHLLWRIYLGTIRYSILYAAKMIPGNMFSEEPLISNEELEKVRQYFEADWERIRSYSEEQFKSV